MNLSLDEFKSNLKNRPLIIGKYGKETEPKTEMDLVIQIRTSRKQNILFNDTQQLEKEIYRWVRLGI